MSRLVNWSDVEKSSWEPIPYLGDQCQWLVKSTASDRGYQVMLTNGCGLWGENKSAKYVLDQAEEWASCIEAGVKELAELVLSEMKRTAKVVWDNDKQNVNLSVSSKLNDMSYCWEFHLIRLSDDLLRSHWMAPLMVQLHYLGMKVKQLTNELEFKNHQLEELLPDNKNSKTANKKKNKTTSIESSVETLLTSGTWPILQEQFQQYPEIMDHLHKKRSSDSVSASPLQDTVAVNNNMRKEQVKSKEELEQEDLLRQQERRAKIQELTQGTATQSSPQKKKKKKLNL